ncbi:ATP-binding protein [Roseateles cellulosilyticus]|uniref:Helix-turn-helix transcriptional regulator n=1 Tax=Pelomonas cellulosilytica TaxID=2906762 RepID=A0ABS8XZF5_9BURK|nr:winged helix-turn-helix domain-containing protein [Pelomonas sp. P8]MCE4554775.1 helix-turn-helix transcriptional regulator [Pelomonas sp. P8]
MSTPHYRFGDFKLLPAERLLFRRGSEVALTARAFELLVAFVERAGQLLSKDELMRRVWAGIVVEENNLAVQVGVLRKLLGAETISTIAGFGYRFALPVLDVAEKPAAAPVPRGRLPLRLPALFGRADELQALQALLQTNPAVTLCGPPGVGKTRLAQELALRQQDVHADGIWWVDLTLLRDDEPVAAAVARTLGLPPGPDPLADLTAKLAPLALMIVLDNAEHRVRDVAETVTALAQHTERVSLLVTSQSPLQAPGERVHRLAPLPLPDAVRLLSERSGEADGARAEQICAALDCNPLAIELAASRVDVLGLDGLAARLHERLTLLVPASAHPSRRNALAEALGWSHDLLAERERRVLRRLAVFPGSFSLEGAALVLSDDELPAAAAVASVLALVERSLVSVDRSSTQRRYRLLETMRLFALDKLAAAGETALAQARHCAGLLWLFEDAHEESWRVPYAAWKSRYEPELPGLWAALDWARDHDLGSAASLFGASAPLWAPRAVDARAHALKLAQLIGDGPVSIPAHVLARFWWACARCHTIVHPGLARDASERAARLYRELGDERGEYLALVEHALNWRVDGPEVRAALAAAHRLENPAWPATVLERGRTTEAVVHLTAGRHDDVRRCYLAALQICERDGFEAGAWRARMNLADVARAAGDLPLAVDMGEALLADADRIDDLVGLTTLLSNLIGALIAQGRFERAREVARDCPRRIGRLGLDDFWVGLDALALLQLHSGNTPLAARLAGVADREFEAHGQMQRQPNEAEDRAMLEAGLAERLPPQDIERLSREGRRMSLSDAMFTAFRFDGDGAVPTATAEARFTTRG